MEYLEIFVFFQLDNLNCILSFNQNVALLDII